MEERMQVEVDKAMYFGIWFMSIVCCLILGGIVGGIEESWGLFWRISSNGLWVPPAIMLLVYLVTPSREEKYLAACNGEVVNNKVIANKIPFWDALATAIGKDTIQQLSRKNAIKVGNTVVNIHAFTSRLKEKTLSREDILLLIQHGDDDLKTRFQLLYAANELTEDDIEAIYAVDPLWIFSFKEFTEKQLFKIIKDWSPYELQGVEIKSKKQNGPRVFNLQKGECLFVRKSSPRNILHLVELFNPDGELITALNRKLEGKALMRAF